jgi:hypothetical protein
MAEKKPLVNSSGKVKELGSSDTLPAHVIADGNKGEVTVSSNGATWNVNQSVKDEALLYALMFG